MSEESKSKEESRSIDVISSEYDPYDQYEAISNVLHPDIIKDITIVTMIRVPAHLGTGRIGVILGCYSHDPNINIEVHENGRARFYWNNGEINLFGSKNLVDGKKHILGFIRNTTKKYIAIYLDGKLEAIVNRCGADKQFKANPLKFGRDYRSPELAFQGDILRLNMWRKAFTDKDIECMTDVWKNIECSVDKQRTFEVERFAVQRKNKLAVKSFTVISLVRICAKQLNVSNQQRIGVILGNYPKTQNCNFEIYTNGVTRLWWNNGQVDLHGKRNLIDNKKHCVIFMRDTTNGTISIYVDGQLDASTNQGDWHKKSSDLDQGTNLLVGRDHRNEGMAFKGDILRINAYHTAFSRQEIHAITRQWLLID
eukprot:315718_1